MKTVSQKILDKISAGELSARPRWWWRAQKIGRVLIIVLGTLSAVFLLSFVLHMLKVRGLWHGTCLDWPSLSTVAPWVMLPLGLLLLLAMFNTLTTSPWIYRRPTIITFGLLALVVFGLSVLVWQTNAHTKISAEVQHCGNCHTLQHLYGVGSPPSSCSPTP